MIYYLYSNFGHDVAGLNVLRYITFRSFMAFITAVLFALYAGPSVIDYLRKIKLGQMVRDDGPKSHLQKQGTPTMGGLLILLSAVISIVLWADLTNFYVVISLIVFLTSAMIGFADDYLKVIKKNTKGLSGRKKLIFQSLLGLGVGILLWNYTGDDRLSFPFFKNYYIHLSYFYPIFVSLVIVASSNSVNLTDGLDGLAIGPIIVVSLTFAIFAYVTGHQVFANHLILQFVPHVGEITIVAISICAAGLGFLWFNAYPAQVFMGDTGSLSLGAMIGLFAVFTKNELLLVLLGGVFVMEAASVITQVIFFKTTGKRVFRMAPIHHHFELKGWPEPKVIVRFWIISILLAVLSLATLKLR